MKQYRIKNYENAGYIVQERDWLIFWNTFSTFACYGITDKIFKSKETAEDFVEKQKEIKRQIKKAKYIRYL
jgi:hypothetical protein